jgi:hypothetical protein
MAEVPPITMTRLPASDIAASVIVNVLQKLPQLPPSHALMPNPWEHLSEIGWVIDIGDEPGLFRLPLQLGASARAQCRGVHACEHREPSEVLGRLFGRLRDDWDVQAAADYLCHHFERHALFGDGMERATGGSPLQREPIDAGRVEPVHGRPAVEPVADIGRYALLARELDEPRNEAVIAMAMDRRASRTVDARTPRFTSAAVAASDLRG